MEILAYFTAALIGISLGLIGGGGSILTVPVMVYLFGVNPLLATSYSLFIVGTTSLIGAYRNWKKHLVNIKTALIFAGSSIITVFLIRKLLIPLLPEQLFALGEFQMSTNLVTMVLFGVLMVIASLSMIREKQVSKPAQAAAGAGMLRLILYGVGIGLTTGLLGAGGGFLLIPTLVLLLGLPMKEAVGTSLMIIALNSLVGFIGDLGHFQIDWLFLLEVSAIAISGLFAGMFLSTKIDGGQLKKGFGWFVLLMGLAIVTKEIFL